MVSLILAERVVLFYAQSGAGKTSLLNAVVIPALEEEGFTILPTARVSGDAPSWIGTEAGGNIFVFSALMTMAGDHTAPETLLGQTLSSFLAMHCQEREERSFLMKQSTLVVFDQFEEIFTTHQERWQERQGFFAQVVEALDAHPQIGVVLVMRQDYVAELDPYAALLPRRLKARFRMERLGLEGALEAVERPAANGGCPFAADVSSWLVDDLRQIKIQRRAEIQEAKALGPYVEPVQLQVVCSRLWEGLPEEKDVILWEDVQKYGDVDRALTGFYEGALAEIVQQAGVNERQLRRWFTRQLITPMKTKGLVVRGEAETEGLSNLAVDILEQRRLIRVQVRAGARWYELAHDRLIDPIVESNEAWEARQETPLRKTAQQWKRTENESLLYRGKALEEALAWALANPDIAESYETEFLAASQKVEQERNRKRRLRRMIIAGLGVGLAIVAVAAVFAFYGWGEARQQTRIATALRLAAQAEVERNRGTWTLASLLAVESIQREPNLEASITLQRLLDGLAQPLVLVELGSDVNTMVLSPDGTWGVSGDEGGTARIWEVDTGRERVRVQHEEPINVVALSPGGEWVLSGSGELAWDSAGEVTESSGGAIVWSPDTGTAIVQVADANSINDAAFSPNGEFVAWGGGQLVRGNTERTIGISGQVRIWNIVAGEEVARLEHGFSTELPPPGHDQVGVLAVAFSPNSRWVASGSEDGTAVVWETATGKEVLQVAHDARVRDVVFSPDGRWIVSGSDDNTARVWSVATGEEVARLLHNGRVFYLAFSPDGRWLISGSDDFKARIWEVETWREVVVLRGHQATVVDAVLSADGQWLLTASNDGTARVWDLETGEEVARIEQEGEIAAVAFAHDDQWVVSGGRDATIRVWNISMMLDERRVEGREVARMMHQGRLNSLAIHPDNQSAVTGGDDGSLWWWDLARTDDIQVVGEQVTCSASQVEVVTYSPNGQWLIVGNRDGTVQVWETSGRRMVGWIEHGWQANSVAFSPNEEWGVSGGGDGIVLVWEVAAAREIARMDHGWEVNAVAFASDGERVVSASHNGTVISWDIETGQKVDQLALPSPLTAVALSRDGQHVAAGYEAGTIWIWDTITAREIRRLEHDGQVLAMAFSSDGQWLVSSSYDGTVRVWEVDSGREVTRIEHVLGYPDNVAFSQNDQWIASISYDTAWIWWWQPQDLVAQVCANLYRNLTREEWSRYLGDEPYHPTCPELAVPEESSH